jgi:hypothetical protein
MDSRLIFVVLEKLVSGEPLPRPFASVNAYANLTVAPRS